MTGQGSRSWMPCEEQYAALLDRHRCKDMSIPPFIKATFMPDKFNLHTHMQTTCITVDTNYIDTHDSHSSYSITEVHVIQNT